MSTGVHQSAHRHMRNTFAIPLPKLPYFLPPIAFTGVLALLSIDNDLSVYKAATVAADLGGGAVFTGIGILSLYLYFRYRKILITPWLTLSLGLVFTIGALANALEAWEASEYPIPSAMLYFDTALEYARTAIAWSALVAIIPILPRIVAFYEEAKTYARDRYELSVRTEAMENTAAEATHEAQEQTRIAQTAQRRSEDLAAEIVVAEQNQRKRLSHDVHDTLTQTNAGALMVFERYKRFYLKNLYSYVRHRRVVPISFLRESKARLDAITPELQKAVRESRDFIYELAPEALEQRGLAEALRLKVEQLRRAGWNVTLNITEPDSEYTQRARSISETALYRIAQEAIQNISKHAEAEHVTITLDMKGVFEDYPGVILSIEDDGLGFDPRITQGEHAPGEQHGMRGMASRVQALGGVLSVDSAPLEGTVVRVRIPLEDEEFLPKGEVTPTPTKGAA